MPDMHGSLVSLSEMVSGSALDTSASSGATTLSLYDVSDFDEDGGFVSIDGTVYTYDSVDMVNDTIHLTSGLSGAEAVDEPVQLWDNDASQVVSEHTALVLVDGQADGDPLVADIDHSLSSLLRQSTLAAGQSVSLVEDGDGFLLTQVHGKNNAATQVSSATTVYWGIDQPDGTVLGLAVAETGGTTLQTSTVARVKTPDNASFQDIQASAFTVSSDSKVKTKPTKAPDALGIIAAAPAKHWRYLTDDKTVKRLGPMADDLPEWLTQPDDEDGHLTVDLARMVGMLWRAVEQLSARVEELEKKS